MLTELWVTFCSTELSLVFHHSLNFTPLHSIAHRVTLVTNAFTHGRRNSWLAVKCHHDNLKHDQIWGEEKRNTRFFIINSNFSRSSSPNLNPKSIFSRKPTPNPKNTETTLCPTLKINPFQRRSRQHKA